MLYNTNIVYKQKMKEVSQYNIKLSRCYILFIKDTLDSLTEPCIGKLSKLLHNQSFTLNEALSNMYYVKFKKRLSYARYHQGKNKLSSMIVIVR